MAAGPIPHSSITRHTEGWAWEDADCFRACMRAMDVAYLDRGAEPEVVDIDPLAAFNRMFGSA